MTKPRSPLSFELALTRVAGQIGWPAIAATVGRSERTVRKWSEEDVRVGVRLDAALALDVAFRNDGGDGAPFLQAYALRFETEVASAMPDVVRLAEATADAAREGGQAIAALVAATRPGATDADRLIARREVEDVVNAFTRSLPMLGPAGGPGDSDTGPGGPK